MTIDSEYVEHPAQTVEYNLRRWNYDQGCWQVWNIYYGAWVPSYLGRNRYAKPPGALVEYADTWAEPERLAL